MIEAGTTLWLLEPENPSARYLALIQVLDRPARDPEAEEARAAIPGWGPAKAILDAQWPEGYWIGPGRGYSPKHKATVWQIIFLAALGAPRTEAIDRACRYVLGASRLSDGRFSATKTARGAVACLNGNLLRAFHQLGYEDARLGQSVEALADMVLRDRFCCRSGPRSAQARTADGLPCTWGAVKALSAFAEIPKPQRSTKVQAAIDAGIEFLLSTGGMGAADPTEAAPRSRWQSFGFPPGRTSDLLETLNVLCQLGVENAPPIAAALEAVQDKRHESGAWVLENSPKNKWASFGPVGQPNKWVTLLALRALKGWNRHEDRDSVGYPR